MAAAGQWTTAQMDVKTAFLYAQLPESVYVHQVPGYYDESRPDHVLKLKKGWPVVGVAQGARFDSGRWCFKRPMNGMSLHVRLRL